MTGQITPRADRWQVVGAVVLMTLTVAMAATSTILLSIGRDTVAYATGGVATDAAGGLAILPAVAVGGFLVIRRSGRPIGWLLLLVSTLFALQNLAGRAIAFTHVLREQPVLGTEILAVVGDAVWLPAIMLAYGWLFVLFPDGRLPSRRWRWLLIVTGLTAAGYVVVTLFARSPLYYLPSVENPLGRLAGPIVVEVGQTAAIAVMMSSIPFALAALGIRWRRGKPRERKQLTWLLWAAGIESLGLLGAMLGSEFLLADAEVPGGWMSVLPDLTGVAFPVAILIAVTRYRLYEIDRVISRTVFYTLLVAILAAVYAGGVVTLRALLGPLTGESDLSVAGSTLLVAALFGPLRGRVRRTIDRRFDRRRYDAEATVAALATHLRDEVDLDEVATQLRRAAHRTLQPARVDLWLRDEEAAP